MPENNDVVHTELHAPSNGEVVKKQLSPIFGETGQWTFDEFGLPVKPGEKSLSNVVATPEDVSTKVNESHDTSTKPKAGQSLMLPESDFKNVDLRSDAGSDSSDEEFTTPNNKLQESRRPSPQPQKSPQLPSPKPETQPELQAVKSEEIISGKSVEEPAPKEIPEAAGDPQIQEPSVPESATPGSQDNVVPEANKAETTSNKHDREASSRGRQVSEWSHQHLAPKKSEELAEEEDEWQTMPAYAPYDIYDDDNRLVAREAHDSDNEADAYAGLGGAGRGYTRVQLDEDAQSATSLDENTKYLFKDVNGGTGAGEEEDEEQRDALSQMQATKDLLTEGQRVAYVGLTRLVLASMLQQQEALVVSKSTRKELQLAAEALQMWSQKMMARLYAHMDISAQEQVMVEQLALPDHGVLPSDLTPTLMINARVKNPNAEVPPSPLRLDSSATNGKSPRPSLSSSRGPLSPGGSLAAYDQEESAQAPPPYVAAHEREEFPEVRTPSQLPTTRSIDIDLRWTVLCDLFLALLADSVYDARSRVLLEKVGENLSIDWIEICRFEKRVTDALEMQQAAEKENWNEDDHKESRRKMALKKRYVIMGLATVGGGLVIGLSAGLLAPVIGAGLAAGFTTIGVAGTGGFLAGAGGAALITSAAATSGGVIAVKAAGRRTGAVKTFEYRPLHNNKRANLIVTVSGWMTGKVDDVRLPYSTVDPIMGDIYSVLWEPEMLQSMGDTINILATEALTQGLQQVLGSTILIGLMAALQLPVVLTKLAYLIDNPWTTSLDRANMAGLILADSLIDRNLGTRPITFVGYSLGSRVIFSCLRELARKGAYGLVQNVYLFGSSIVAKKEEFLRARSVVAGRFVNGYATNDWILGYLFRLTSGGISRVAGLAPVEGIPGLENVNVTEFVPGHMAYRTAMPRLLREVGWIVESDVFTEIEEPDPENHAQRQRELINEIEEARKEFEKEEKQSKGKFGGFFSRKKKKEKQAWETYEESKGELTEEELKNHGTNDGVLFDVDAIRAELASDQMEIEVKELKSTLPALKLDLGSPTTLQPRSQLKETRSFDHANTLKTPTFQPSPAASPRHSTTFPSASPRVSTSGQTFYREPERPVSPYDDGSDGMQMTFDTAYRSPPRSARTSSSHLPLRQASPANHWPDPSSQPPISPRPSLTTSHTAPASLPLINLDHNAWADEDEDFGQEREIEMTFA